VKRRWRFYETSAGRRPVREFLDERSAVDAAAIAAAMKDVALAGLLASRHLRGDVYEVRLDGDRQSYRVLFAAEGSRGQILLALEAFSKKSQRTPAAMVEDALARRQLLRQLAEDRRAEGLTRTTVAARMGTSESAVARLEGGEADTKLSTLARYAAALGKRIE
jgi:phage-related protein